MFNTNPTNVRLTGKELYNLEKSNKQTKSPKLKEVRIKPEIGTHDLDIKVKQCEDFLKKKHSIRIRLTFKGRQITHPELGWDVVNEMTTKLSNVGKIVSSKLDGKQIIVMVAPK